MKTKIVLFFLFLSSIVIGQTKVGGNVTDEFGDPIAFANVIFQNSKEGVITDENGNFYQAGVFYAYEACALGFRRGGKILNNMSKFVGHIIK